MIKLYEYYIEYVYENVSNKPTMTNGFLYRRFLEMPNDPIQRMFINREIETKTKYLLDMENAI